MNDTDRKAKQIDELRSALIFFSNGGKIDREKWVVSQLLKAMRIDFKEDELIAASEPADIEFRGVQFQVKEMLDKGRRRTDEYKQRLAKAESARNFEELIEPYTPKDISFSKIVEQCYEYAESLKTKYGWLECKNIDLLCYFNWQDYSIVPPIEVFNKETIFRSLSVVSNLYCTVASVMPNAPILLREHVGKVGTYREADA
ncbi:DUF1780 domain-containing protein [Chitiniphilus purpureus]|uniref:DUF1780 domain-containing protein n=1 Tax=Chitiniphilus purpureus TaxID=2981137 RepID=A0ABY6DGX5_9NEIS|nr:DUF1780 domain-containing protein [Chitiniphilus sp. CD1]UXY13612.1 DUF1780 domain-containing protein [Chitiniphilus sp. CD1]